MGGGISTIKQLDPGSPPRLSKADIKELYEHVHKEYELKLSALVSSRASLDGSGKAESDTEKPKQLPAPREAPAEEEYLDSSLEEEAIVETMQEHIDAVEDDGENSDEDLHHNTNSPLSTVLVRARNHDEKLYEGPEIQRKLIELVLDDQPEILRMKIKVNPKALRLLGDEGLDKMARQTVGDAKITPKVLARLGEACIIPEKALKRLGSTELSLDQRRAMQEADLRDQHAKDMKRIKELEKLLNAKPTEEIEKIGKDTIVKDKALQMMGGIEDDKLMSQLRKQVTTKMTVNKKTIQLTGGEILPDKLKNICGGEMTEDQRRAMMQTEIKEKRKSRGS